MSARSHRAARATASGPKSAGCNGPFRRSRALRVGLRRRSRATWRWGGGGWHPETTMSTEYPASCHQREPWNKGRLVGQKRRLKPRDVWTATIARGYDLATPVNDPNGASAPEAVGVH